MADGQGTCFTDAVGYLESVRNEGFRGEGYPKERVAGKFLLGEGGGGGMEARGGESGRSGRSGRRGRGGWFG